MAETENGQIVFKASSAVFDENDDRWQGQVQALLEDLRAAGGRVKKEATPVAGAKGGVTDIVLALGSSGALSLAVVAFKAWLARDKNRSVTLTETRDGVVVREVKVTAENVSEKMLRDAWQKT